MGYAIEVIICSCLFILLYKTLLEGRIMHKAARAYLVSSIILSVTFPALNIPIYPAIPAQTVQKAEMFMEMFPYYNENETMAQQTIGIENETDRITMPTSGDIASAIWLTVFIINLALTAKRLFSIFILRRKSKIYIFKNHSLAINENVTDPFSFMSTIYMNRTTHENGCGQIMAHETSHIRHHHTTERMFMELMRCFFWYNPFVWIAGQCLIEVQEWEADADVLDEGYDMNEYRTIIFSRLIGYNPDMTNGLHNKTTKKRFIMMTQNKRDKFSFIRLLMAVPLAAGMFLAFSCTTGRATNLQQETIMEAADTIAGITFRPPSDGQIMHFFGDMQSLGGETFPHNAVDFIIKSSDPILATADGTVTEVAYSDKGYGNYIRIDHEQGYQSFYAHLTEILVKAGDKVSMGDKIGLGGDSGRIVKPHLQFSILKDGQYIDPMPLIYPHPTAEEILGKWIYHSIHMVTNNRNLKAYYPEHYDRIVNGLGLTKGADYIELTKDGELLFVDSETKSAQKARYTYNPEDARLTVDLEGVMYEVFLNLTNSGHLAATNYARKYIEAAEKAGRLEINYSLQALKEVNDVKEGMFAGVLFSR